MILLNDTQHYMMLKTAIQTNLDNKKNKNRIKNTFCILYPLQFATPKLNM